ncbi:MAG: hypothetical protein AAGG44_17815, partial [Planctomycetota bacterium]
MDCDSLGNLWLTDWVQVDYPNHGKGRIWKIGVRDSDELTAENRIEPKSYFGMHKQAINHRGESKSRLGGPGNSDSSDPLDQFAAYVRKETDELRRGLRSQVEQTRLNSFIALQRTGRLQASEIRTALSDTSVDLRIASLRAASLRFSPDLQSAIDQVLEAGEVTGELFAAWLSAKQVLEPNYCNAVKLKAKEKSNAIPMADVDWEPIAAMMTDRRLDASVRSRVLEYLPAEQLESRRSQFIEALRGSDSGLVESCLEQLTRCSSLASSSEVQAELISMLADRARSPVIRALAASHFDAVIAKVDLVSLAMEELEREETVPIAVALVDRLRELDQKGQLEQLHGRLAERRTPFEATVPRRILENFEAVGITDTENSG